MLPSLAILEKLLEAYRIDKDLSSIKRTRRKYNNKPSPSSSLPPPPPPPPPPP
jgi:hypothetical protein